MARVTGVPADLLSQMQANVLATLSSDTASISGEVAALPGELARFASAWQAQRGLPCQLQWSLWCAT